MARRRNRLRILALVFSVMGSILAVSAFAVDWLGIGGQPGFGAKQILMILLGLGGMTIGALLGLPRSQSFLLDWRPPPVLSSKPPSPFLIGGWFGLLTGLIDVIYLLGRRYILGELIFQGSDFVWMAPLADVALFAAVAIAMATARRWVKGLRSVRATLTIFSFLLFYSLCLKLHWLQQLAALLLSVGLAVQFARVVGSRPNALYFLIHMSIGWPGLLRAWITQIGTNSVTNSGPAKAGLTRREFLAGIGFTLGGLVLATGGAEAFAESKRRAVKWSVRPGMPNVLLIVLDTVRAKSLGLYGYGRPTTPRLERLARYGTVFKSAFSTAPWTLASHATMFTGRYPHELSTGFLSPLDTTYPTLAELFTSEGYQTAGFAANTFYASQEFGLSRGFTHYEDYRVSGRQILDSADLTRELSTSVRHRLGNFQGIDLKRASDINRSLKSWLEKQDPTRPFFAFLNYFDAHAPYLPPREFALSFGGTSPSGKLPIPDDGNLLSAVEIRGLNDDYDAAIAYLDDQVGRLMDDLNSRGLLDNTLVVVTSDHGELFGEHGMMEHTASLYLPLLHVPLLMTYPGHVPAATEVTADVSLRDLAATIADLAGLKNKDLFPGSSLAQLWSVPGSSDSTDGEPLLAVVDQAQKYPLWYPATKGAMQSIIANGHHYIKNLGDGREELYDLASDPEENHDLSGTSLGRPLVDRFRALVGQMVQPQ